MDHVEKMMTNRMNIVSSTDDGYALYLAVALCSVCENNRGEDIDFHIIVGNGISGGNEALIRKVVERYEQRLTFYRIDEKLVSSFPLSKNSGLGHISLATYYRLYLTSILPDNIDKVLYLDCDIICRKNLSPVFGVIMDEVAVAVVPDMDEGNLNVYRRLRYSPSMGYFNAGVMLVNLEYWRYNNMTEQFLDFIKMYPERMLYNDQDVMNFVLREHKILLPVKYNVQEAALYERVNISWEYDEQLEEAVKDPAIIHFTTSPKPWNIGCKHPWQSEWTDYLTISGIPDFEYVECRSTKRTFYQKIRGLMVKVGFLEPLFRFRKDILSTSQ